MDVEAVTVSRQALALSECDSAKLSAVVEPREQAAFCHRLVQFGRDVCTARAPRCAECPLSGICAHVGAVTEK